MIVAISKNSPEWHPVASSSLNCSCSSLAFSVTHVCSRNPWTTQYSQSRCDEFLSNVVKKSRMLIFIHTASGALSSPPASQKSAPVRMGPSAVVSHNSVSCQAGIDAMSLLEKDPPDGFQHLSLFLTRHLLDRHDVFHRHYSLLLLTMGGLCTRLRFFWPVMFAESWTLNDTDGSKTEGKFVVESLKLRFIRLDSWLWSDLAIRYSSSLAPQERSHFSTCHFHSSQCAVA
jgi:hypothetical protein